jgi:hypothetical protein
MEAIFCADQTVRRGDRLDGSTTGLRPSQFAMLESFSAIAHRVGRGVRLEVYGMDQGAGRQRINKVKPAIVWASPSSFLRLLTTNQYCSLVLGCDVARHPRPPGRSIVRGLR